MTNKIKMIALDMDNTLLRPDKTLSKRNTKVLQSLHTMGKSIVLTTGRPFPNVQPFLSQLQLNQVNDYAILFNGAIIKNIYTNQNLINHVFTLSDVDEVFNLIHNIRLPIDLVTQNNVYSIKDFGKSGYVELVGKLIPYSEKLLSELTPDLMFNKFVVCATDTELNYLENVLLHTPILTKNINFVRSRRNLLEFVPNKVNKGAALSKLLKQLSLTPDNLMAFGDEANDYSMLSLARVSVAMDNAIPSIKKISTNITKNNAKTAWLNFWKIIFHCSSYEINQFSHSIEILDKTILFS